MAGRQVAVMQSIGQLFHSGPVAGLDDGELLERFAARNDEAAFAALVALHGPMVLGVCRRILRDGHDVEDAFQATFLVLVKRAGSIRDPGRLGPWLHGVARRVAMRARAEAARRRSHQDSSGPAAVAEEHAVRSASRAEGDDVLEIIDEEVARLPSRYREAVVLCDLEGRSYAEAARRLRCPLGTLQSRLARGRARLRTRLVKRGVAPMALAATLAEGARAAVPEALAEATVRAATAGVVSASTAALAGYVARSLVMSTVKDLAVTFCLASVVLGAGLLGHGRLSAEPAEEAAVAAPAPETPPPTPPQPEPKPLKADRTLELEVVDGTDHSPLPGASVWVRASRGRAYISQGTTDEQGRSTITITAGAPSFLQVVVVHPGFAPTELRWAGEEPIPDTYTVAMERGVPIGGTVQDQQGRPIAGARVHLQVGAAPPGGGRERYPDPESEVAAAITDDQGRWRSEALPASVGPGVQLDLVTTHSDHVGLKRSVTAAALRAFAASEVMETGRSLSGTVLSPTGRPVAGATVVVQSRSDRKTLRRVQSDRDGRFQTGPFIDPKWSEFTMVVQADGFASFAQLLLVPAEIPPQTIRLSPRKPLHGRVVDAQGGPIAGAIVRSATEFGFAGLDWDAETGPDGRFVWFEAPATGTYMLDVEKPPFRQIVALMVPGGSDDLEITLHRPQRLHGMVTDAETGRPVERFVVIEGWGPIRPGWPPDWHRNSARLFGGGKYDLTRPGIEQQMVRSIRIEAEGYEPAEFLGFPDGPEDIAHDFKLRKAAMLAGIVRGPDGRPMAGVDVILSGAGFDTPIHNGRLRPGQGRNAAPRIRTGPDGRYAFRPQGRHVSVVAIHDTGFAARSADDLTASTDLTLVPWGRVEGLVKIGDEPASGESVAGWLRTSSDSASLHYETHTLATGRIVLDRVAPGRLTVYRRVETEDKGWTPSHTVSLDVKPGETARLQIGGTGRPVIGRLAIPEGVKLSHFAVGHGHGSLAPVLPEPPTPDDFLVFDSEQRAAWWDAFARTPEGRAYVEDRDRSYAVALSLDGTFRLEDVPAGRYVLKLPFEGLSRGTREGRQAFARTEVVVPEMADGRSDEPLDIGAIPLEVFPFHEPRVGDPAPVIAAKAPDGRPLDLAALRGKFVLPHFWSGRPEDAAAVPPLKATYDAFGRDPRFVMIGLNADETPEPVRRYAAHHGLSWEQRYIGSTYDPNPFEAAFGVWSSPVAFLIGPDGRIIAKDLQGDAIREAVARALKPQPPPRPQQGAAGPPRADRTLELEVVDAADNTPLAGASVWACAYRGQEQTSQGTTDGEGRHAISLTGRPAGFFEVVVAHPGFAPAALSWWDWDMIPDRLTVAMERGAAIGGTVRDEQGQPIAGARVHLLGERPPGGGRSAYPRPESEIAAAVTDDQGRWRSEALPRSAGPDVKLALLTMHPDHIALKQSVTADALRASAPVAVLKAGRSVSGSVVSPTGRPVAGATVVVLSGNGVGNFQRLRTDAGGRFRTGRFIDPTWDELRLSVQADGFASAMWRLANTPEIPSQAVRLSPRKPMRGRVVDAQGRPVPGATVLPSREYFNGKLDWEAETDADGRFEWFEAPATGTILLDVVKASFRTILCRPVAAGSGDVVLTLHRPQHLHGTAIDAETGRPIGRFTLIPGDGPHLPGWAVDWKRDQARIFTDGRFDLAGDLSADRGEPRSIRIEADGYEPAECLSLPGDAEDVARDVKLRKDTRKKIALSGIVRGPDGRPIAGAEVALGDGRNGIRIEDGRLARQGVSASHRAETDREGRYAFPPCEGGAWIVVVHDAGFAMRSPEQLAASTDITLAPWGRIEGVLQFGPNPAPGQGIRALLDNRRFPGFVDANVQTDRDGRFVFERVTPGRLIVCRPVRHHESGHTPSHAVDVDVAPGQTARIQIGGTGRPVVGRLALPEGAAMNHFLNGPTRLHSAPPALPIPAESPRLTDEQWSAWRDALSRTPEWEDYFEGKHQYAVAFRPDGTFRIEDVPAGRYILELPFRGNAGGNQPARRAFAKADVVVPDLHSGRSDEPLDIGVIPLDVFPFRELNVGDRVPGITSGADDGRPLDLAALRGKFVLLAFWATSHLATRASIPYLNATYDAFGRDPRLVMIGLNQDISPELMRRYAAHRGLAWEQRHLGGWGDTNPIAAAFGVRYPAAVFLIGPDGRIVAKDLQGDAIKQAVARALGAR